MKDKRLSVSAIKNGTVIDHIPAEVLFKVVSILNLDTIENMITIGNSLESHKLGKKEIIKLSEVFFKDNEDVNTRFKVVSKSEVKLKCHYCEKITDRDNIQII